MPRAGDVQSEPRWVTITDLMVAVAALALAIGLLRKTARFWDLIGLSTERIYRQSLSYIAIAGPTLIVVAFILALIILVRRLRYGGMPRPAEWSSILLGVSLPSGAALQWFYDVFDPPLELLFFTPRYWEWSAVFGLACLGFMASIVLADLSSQTRMLLLTIVAWLLLCGPIHGYSLWSYRALVEYSVWSMGWRWAPLSWQREALSGAMFEIARLPALLLFGLPAVAALSSLKKKERPAWLWTDWMSLAIILTLLLCRWLDGVEYMFAPYPAARVSITVRGIELGIVGLVDWLIVLTCGPLWLGWVEKGNSRIAP